MIRNPVRERITSKLEVWAEDIGRFLDPPLDANGFHHHLVSTGDSHRWRNTFVSLDARFTENILEIGCDEGLTTKELLKQYPLATVYAIDVNRRVVDHVSYNLEKDISNGRLKVMEGDGYFAKHLFPDTTFQAVLMMNNITFMVDQIPDSHLGFITSQIDAVLEDPGYLFFSANREHAILKKQDGRYTVERHRSYLNEKHIRRIMNTYLMRE